MNHVSVSLSSLVVLFGVIHHPTQGTVFLGESKAATARKNLRATWISNAQSNLRRYCAKGDLYEKHGIKR